MWYRRNRKGKAKGQRPAYPTKKGVLTTIGNRSASGKGDKPIATVDYDDKYINDTTKLTACPTALNQVVDLHAWVTVFMV